MFHVKHPAFFMRFRCVLPLSRSLLALLCLSFRLPLQLSYRAIACFRIERLAKYVMSM